MATEKLVYRFCDIVVEVGIHIVGYCFSWHFTLVLLGKLQDLWMTEVRVRFQFQREMAKCCCVTLNHPLSPQVNTQLGCREQHLPGSHYSLLSGSPQGRKL